MSLIGTITRPPLAATAGGEECRFEIAIPRRSRRGDRQPGVIYLECVLHGAEAGWAERLADGVIVGLAGRLDVDREHGPNGWRETHAVLVDQLDYLGPPAAAES